MEQLAITSQIEVGSTVQRMEDNETRTVAEIERDENGHLHALVLANLGGLIGEPDRIEADEMHGWVWK